MSIEQKIEELTLSINELTTVLRSHGSTTLEVPQVVVPETKPKPKPKQEAKAKQAVELESLPTEVAPTVTKTGETAPAKIVKQGKKYILEGNVADLEELKRSMMALSSTKSRDAARAVLAQFKAKSISMLKPEQYLDVMKAIVEAL